MSCCGVWVVEGLPFVAGHSACVCVGLKLWFGVYVNTAELHKLANLAMPKSMEQSKKGLCETRFGVRTCAIA